MDNNQNQRNNNPLGGGSNSPRRQNIILLLVAALVTMVCMSYFLRAFSDNTNKEITYNEFIQMVDDGKVEKIVIDYDKIDIYPKESKDNDKLGAGYSYWTGNSTVTYYTGKAEEDSILTDRMLKAGVEVSSKVPDNSGVILSVILQYVVPILLMWFLLSMIFKKMGKGGGPLSVGKSNAKVYVQKETGVTFKDVAGEDEAKESLVEVVDFLHNPSKYVKIGAKLPKGALLVGPPGTGKTLLAKAVAGEAQVPFYSLAGSDFIELYVGVGASRVRDLFSEASKNAPCIIFIDEIDAIGRSRDSKYGGGNEEREQTLNQLLSEMDGFDSSKGVLILGATNRPEILDKALLRPGRFDRRIIVDRPDLKGREEILKVHSKDVKMDETVDLKAMALATSGLVGSDLANMINEGAINAVKAGRECVNQQDLMEALEQVIAGKEKKDKILSKEERKIVSYHEVGHAITSAVLDGAEPVQKITIVPRTKGSLGYVLPVPEDETFLHTKQEILDEITVLLAGRASEEVIFNTVTDGAFSDIEKATAKARSMITMLGMSDRFGLMQLESIQNQYLDGNRVLQCSDETATLVDEEVKNLLAQCYERAKKIISEHLDTMDKIAEFLIEKETITGAEFMKIYREAENIPEPTEEEKEANRSKRLYATRPESARVGENVPVKQKEEAKNEQAPSEQPKTETTAEPEEEKKEQTGENTDNDQDQSVTTGGLFSHVPDNFKK
ncbi:ATP-dependent metallopeptidase FtsH/Yme1/Tma family protein [Butyrivibrio sp. X503]|uniref:ATP-dependent zinc metalloprotease FtsH n=1 Tax=Butyrivibrio sp. X503 TaxID=2364878 RepID=UPI000EA915F5|nr:ATP-dependent zinc metalloprotease FtsH [Butyrivibrio sp. X503]RKM53843.1 ATP-dependent metallopeptidase FtsH/Yme1/Tma family protein [Butyrivibrio sp. X503]